MDAVNVNFLTQWVANTRQHKKENQPRPKWWKHFFLGWFGIL